MPGGPPPHLRQIVAATDAHISFAPSDGLVIVGVSAGSESSVRGHISGAPGAIGMPMVARHAAAMEGKQAATLIAGMSLAWRTAYVEQNVDSRLGEGAWRQADVICLWAVQQIMELPGAADSGSFADFTPAFPSPDATWNCRCECPLVLEAQGSNRQVTARGPHIWAASP